MVIFEYRYDPRETPDDPPDTIIKIGLWCDRQRVAKADIDKLLTPLGAAITEALRRCGVRVVIDAVSESQDAGSDPTQSAPVG